MIREKGISRLKIDYLRNKKMKFRLCYFILWFLFSPGWLFAQKDMPAYKIYNSEGKEQSWKAIMRSIPGADIVFFGELHDNPVSHWLELKVLEEIYQQRSGKLIIGAEMFESDQQLILDEYISGIIDAKRFEQGTHLWSNYTTDYRPLLEFARDSGLVFIATNLPRRYANLVSKNGFEILDSLSDAAKSLIVPLPVEYDPEVGSYKKMMGMSMVHGEGNKNFPKAQALKDATMAHFILENLKEKYCFMHINGSFHSDFQDGIIWYIRNSGRELKILNLTTVLQDDIYRLEDGNFGRADFIIVVPSDMNRSY